MLGCTSKTRILKETAEFQRIKKKKILRKSVQFYLFIFFFHSFQKRKKVNRNSCRKREGAREREREEGRSGGEIINKTRTWYDLRKATSVTFISRIIGEQFLFRNKLFMCCGGEVQR